MALDGFVISNLVHELNEKLCNGRISKIAQPESDELLFTIKSNQGQFRLAVSASASLPFVYLTEQNKPSPLTAPNFVWYCVSTSQMGVLPAFISHRWSESFILKWNI